MVAAFDTTGAQLVRIHPGGVSVLIVVVARHRRGGNLCCRPCPAVRDLSSRGAERERERERAFTAREQEGAGVSCLAAAWQ